MSCKFDTFLLQDYLDGAVDALEKIFVEEHLKTCKECRKELSTMKLLFWELNDIKGTEIEIPEELDEIRQKSLDRIFENSQKSMNLKEVVGIQKKNLINAGKFMQYIPGAKTGEKYIKSSLKKAPSAALKLSGSILKGGFKLIQMRYQT